MKTFAYLFGFGLLLTASALAADNPVIVHEWGTFTCLQDEKGQAIGGINVDDEPVPSFVYSDSGGQGIQSQYSHELGNFGLPPYLAGKGWAAGDPEVTMRLETPVLYMYPPKGQLPSFVPPLDVRVDFHGGFLTQFYPYADEVPFNGQGTLTETSVGSLNWAGVRIGSKEKPIETDDKVWTTPREVSAPLLETTMRWRDGGNQLGAPVLQAEHFLFYRGVGHLDSPIRLGLGSLGQAPVMWVQTSSASGIRSLDSGWLVDIRPDGSCAYHASAPELQQNPWAPLGLTGVAHIASTFTSTDFASDNLTKLKASMQDALVKAGLYPDEASAMLRTWELSYFKSPGLRFFYIVPNEWVNGVLPLKITGAPTKITRVMVGRIEMVTDQQRQALERLAQGPCPDLSAVKHAAEVALKSGKWSKKEVDAFYRGGKPLSELGIIIPPLIQDYLNLGRFRDALVINEYQKWPRSALWQFITENKIAPEGMKLNGRVRLPGSPDVTLKNPGRPDVSNLHY